jgi:nucleotide-binding universal stress UspA family protein
MNAIRSLVAATDFSDHAHNGLARAACIAAEQQAALVLLHVMSGSALKSLRDLFAQSTDVEARLIAEAKRTLDQIATDIAGEYQVPVTSRVEVGAVLTEILAVMEQADLLVTGAYGMNPLRDLLLGSTAERLLSKCMRPTLVVKRPPQDTYRRVIVPVDFSPYSASALMAAIRIAPKSQIYVCHAFDVPFEGKLWIAGASDEKIDKYRVQAHQQALTAIRDLIERVGGGNAFPISSVAERGDAIQIILNKEAEHDADLIVIGKHGRSAAEEFFLGSVTRRVLSNSTCDVLVVNEKRSE